MEQPKEPGFYWARLVDHHARCRPVRWEPVEFVPGMLRQLAVGADDPFLEVVEWGPRIESPGAHGWRITQADESKCVVVNDMILPTAYTLFVNQDAKAAYMKRMGIPSGKK